MSTPASSTTSSSVVTTIKKIPKIVKNIIYIIGCITLLIISFFAYEYHRSHTPNQQQNSSSSNTRSTSNNFKSLPTIMLSNYIGPDKSSAYTLKITEESQLIHDVNFATVKNSDDIYVDDKLIKPGKNWPGGFKELRIVRPVSGESTLVMKLINN